MPHYNADEPIDNLILNQNDTLDLPVGITVFSYPTGQAAITNWGNGVFSARYQPNDENSPVLEGERFENVLTMGSELSNAMPLGSRKTGTSGKHGIVEWKGGKAVYTHLGRNNIDFLTFSELAPDVKIPAPPGLPRTSVTQHAYDQAMRTIENLSLKTIEKDNTALLEDAKEHARKFLTALDDAARNTHLAHMTMPSYVQLSDDNSHFSPKSPQLTALYKTAQSLIPQSIEGGARLKTLVKNTINSAIDQYFSDLSTSLQAQNPVASMQR